MAKRGPKRTVRRQDVRDVLQRHGREPLTAPEVAAALDCHKDTVADRLHELHELGDVGTKKVGARARVWWLTPSDVQFAEYPRESARSNASNA